MNNEQTLSKAIEKAIKNGYDKVRAEVLMAVLMNNAKRGEQNINGSIVNDFILSHEFAKAFFGENWKYYIQQAVLSSDRIKYLEKFL